MNSFTRFLAVIPSLVWLACAKQSGDGNPENDTSSGRRTGVEISVVNGDGPTESKMRLEGLSPVWEQEDCLSVFGPSGTNDKFTALSTAGKNAVFTGTTDVAGPYVAVYPYDENNAVSEGSVEISVPAVQQLAEGDNIASGAITGVASAASLSSGLNFRNVVSILKFEVTDESTESLMFVSNGGPIAGRVKVSPSTAQVEDVIEGSSTVTLLPAGDTFTPGTYYIAVLPFSTEGITMSATRVTDARRGNKTSLKTFTAARNIIYNMGKVDAAGLDWAYRIYNRKDLYDYAGDSANWSIEEDINLCADIDMEGKLWHTLDDRLSVNGTFEGNGHCIYNINITENTMQYVGFFGRYYKNIRNLTLGSKDGINYDGTSRVTNSYNVDNTGWTYTGGCIVWPAENRIIENVRNFSTVTTTSACTHKSRTAGVVTWIESAGVTIKDCANYGSVTSNANSGTDSNINCGGVVSGVNSTGVTIDACCNYGTVTGSHLHIKGIGGIVGQNYSAAANLVISNCTNKGNVSITTAGGLQNAEASVGGIAGKMICKAGATPVRISDCTNEGNVSTNANNISYAGGITGSAYGVDLYNCTNSGRIENNSVSQLYQAVGGIAGICAPGYGTNSIIRCSNRGDVVYKGKSTGYDATDGTGDVYGVDAGGIVGLVCKPADEISGNINYGTVTGTNSLVGTTSFPKAYMFVGGIVGYDYGVISVFKENKNSESAIITSNVTDASSTKTKPYAVAGGIIGYQKYSTMIDGTSLGTVRVSASSGNRFAGSITGWNKAIIRMCYYGGTVNGGDASADNVVGYGDNAQACAPASSLQTDEYDSGLGNVETEDGTWD